MNNEYVDKRLDGVFESFYRLRDVLCLLKLGEEWADFHRGQVVPRMGDLFERLYDLYEAVNEGR